MANGTVARASETVETIPPKVTTTAKNVAGDVKVEAKQGSTTEVKTVYLEADGVFAEIPVVIVDMITAMTKAQYSQQIVASGTITDRQLCNLRMAWLQEKVSSLYKSWIKANEISAMNKARKFYLDLRARGFAKDEAAKLANYNPLD